MALLQFPLSDLWLVMYKSSCVLKNEEKWENLLIYCQRLVSGK